MSINLDIVAIFGKFTSLLLKAAKSLKFLLAAGTFGAYAFFFTWKFAILIMFGIGIHEMGHVLGMRYCGMKTKGFYFIPLIGGASIAEGAFPSGKVEGFVALMGPTFGVITLIPPLILFIVTQHPMWASAAVFLAMVNIFNLFPVNPLDGGRFIKSIAFALSQGLGIFVMGLGFILAILISWKMGLTLLVFIAIIGMMEIRPLAPYIMLPIMLPAWLLACIITFIPLWYRNEDLFSVFKGGFEILFYWDKSKPIIVGSDKMNPDHWKLSKLEMYTLIAWYAGLVLIFIGTILVLAHVPGANIGQHLKS